MLIFSNNTKQRKGFLPEGQSRKLVVPTYHLHRNTRNRGNFGWKIKWFTALCLGSFRSYGLCLWQCNCFSTLFQSVQLTLISFIAGHSPTTSNFIFYVYALDFHWGDLWSHPQNFPIQPESQNQNFHPGFPKIWY